MPFSAQNGRFDRPLVLNSAMIWGQSLIAFRMSVLLRLGVCTQRNGTACACEWRPQSTGYEAVG